MNEWNDEEIRRVYRDYLAQELNRPEVAQAQKKLAAQFSAKPAPVFAPAFSFSFCLLAALFLFFYQIQPPVRDTTRPQTQPVMFSLSPKPVVDAVKPSAPNVLVKKISSSVGPTLVYQKNHRDVPITVIWVFPGGQ